MSITPVAIEIFRSKWDLCGIRERLLYKVAFWQMWSNFRTFWVIRGCLEFLFSKMRLWCWSCQRVQWVILVLVNIIPSSRHWSITHALISQGEMICLIFGIYLHRHTRLYIVRRRAVAEIKTTLTVLNVIRSVFEAGSWLWRGFVVRCEKWVHFSSKSVSLRKLLDDKFIPHAWGLIRETHSVDY